MFRIPGDSLRMNQEFTEFEPQRDSISSFVQIYML